MWLTAPWRWTMGLAVLSWTGCEQVDPNREHTAAIGDTPEPPDAAVDARREASVDASPDARPDARPAPGPFDDCLKDPEVMKSGNRCRKCCDARHPTQGYSPCYVACYDATSPKRGCSRDADCNVNGWRGLSCVLGSCQCYDPTPMIDWVGKRCYGCAAPSDCPVANSQCTSETCRCPPGSEQRYPSRSYQASCQPCISGADCMDDLPKCSAGQSAAQEIAQAQAYIASHCPQALTSNNVNIPTPTVAWQSGLIGGTACGTSNCPSHTVTMAACACMSYGYCSTAYHEMGHQLYCATGRPGGPCGLPKEQTLVDASYYNRFCAGIADPLQKPANCGAVAQSVEDFCCDYLKCGGGFDNQMNDTCNKVGVNLVAGTGCPGGPGRKAGNMTVSSSAEGTNDEYSVASTDLIIEAGNPDVTCGGGSVE
jgi:hypothetical protein